jgi:geranylgeranyl diphosphate synthase type I
MYFQIKNRLDKELEKLARDINKTYGLRGISAPLYNEIKGFILRKGKRLRPILFIMGYLGFAESAAKGLYKTALSLELLHDFLLIHDDIIDKSAMRRGKPSLHKKFDGYLSGHKKVKFDGSDLAIVAGDVIYAIAIHSFLAISEDPSRKEKALGKFLESTVRTGSGEFVELLFELKDIGKASKEDIYKIYDLKTAHYSFSSPLSSGAMLAGARAADVERLRKAGIHMGRAFQIKDDILGVFADEKKAGKSPMDDLREGKKTLLIWHAYNNSKPARKRYIRQILSKKNVTRRDLLKIREILVSCGSLKYAEKLASAFLKKADALLASSGMKRKYRDSLRSYSKALLR